QKTSSPALIFASRHSNPELASAFPEHFVHCRFGVDIGDTLQQSYEVGEDLIIAMAAPNGSDFRPYARTYEVAGRFRSLVLTKHNAFDLAPTIIQFDDKAVKAFIRLPDMR